MDFTVAFSSSVVLFMSPRSSYLLGISFIPVSAEENPLATDIPLNFFTPHQNIYLALQLLSQHWNSQCAISGFLLIHYFFLSHSLCFLHFLKIGYSLFFNYLSGLVSLVSFQISSINFFRIIFILKWPILIISSGILPNIPDQFIYFRILFFYFFACLLALHLICAFLSSSE